ncbi:uncharacterized protein SAMN05892883_0592 [Jatrophihabitans sp. GAS493]|uniref:oxygenase MpaB family protein n=1 Tax=Jatrophihabitans sp. GAS493 TaxID=1907575 RepID=UPI000BBFBEC9|nr:oxygenase MpaB family protein [Jatrophihabitans sp. GAS493]SOD70981.1 uncharacterized protein SAMN05892883_0592 [Jatrophihabitans sp. GAS493]
MPEYLGPDSLTWKHFGDWRGMLLTLWAGSMQNMHPQLGAGVEEHSHFFDERWERLYRSLYPIGGVVYDGPQAAETARKVRDYHLNIKGIDKAGRPYSALNPETYFWAHTTFLLSSVLVCEYFGTPLTLAEKEQIYAEGVQWYRLYGLSMRPVPPDWASFMEYYDYMCREVLEDNWATRAVLDLKAIAAPPKLAGLPDVVWRVLRGPTTRLLLWITVAAYPDSVRRRLGYRWTKLDALLFKLVGRSIALGWHLVPLDRRYHPRAAAGWRRSRELARTGEFTDEPLVESPAIYEPKWAGTHI